MYFAKEIASNDYVHQAFAAYTNPKKIARLMLDGDELKPYYKFCRDASSLLKEFDRERLEGEYGLAVRRANFARDIRQFLREKDVLPNLRWNRTPHSDGCKWHDEFVGRVWAIDDPFWLYHQPLDKPECHCYLSATRDSVTDNSDLPTSTKPLMRSWKDLIRNYVPKPRYERHPETPTVEIVVDFNELLAKSLSDKHGISISTARQLVMQAAEQ